MRVLKPIILSSILAALLLAGPAPSGAISLQTLKDVGSSLLGSKSSSSSDVSESDVVSGLKQALNIAVEKATGLLGKTGGYLDNPEVFIPMPDELSFMAKAARFLGQDELVDNFVASMNHAAEQAAGETVDVFGKAISDMTMEDARSILDGADDAATQYFKTHTKADLAERIQPIVSKAMESNGVTRNYNALTKGVASTVNLAGFESKNLEEYVTDKALDGLFLVMAKQEADFRNDPVQWTTDLLKRVFGSAK